MSLSQYGKDRDELVDRIVRALGKDRRVCAAWLSGSFGRGEADEWSDLDLHLAIEDSDLEAFLVEREALYQQVGRPILTQHDVASDSQTGARFQLVIYPGPIEVDWNIGPASQAQRPLAYRMLVERASIPVVAPAPLTPDERRTQIDHWLTFFWAMAPIGVKLCGRGDTRRAMKQIDLLTTAFIALWRLVSEPNGPAPILPATNRVLEPELESQIPVMDAVIRPLRALEIVGELCRQVERFHPALEEMGATIPRELPAEVEKLHRIADEMLRRGDVPRPRYR